MENKSALEKMKDAIASAGQIIGASIAGASNAMGADSSSNEIGGIEKHVESKSMISALLRGEVTKEVEELRYRTILINREADRHEEARKKNISLDDVAKEHFVDGKIKFTQPNDYTTLNSSESFRFALEHGDKSPEMVWRIDVKNNAVGKVNISKMCESVTVDIDDSKNQCLVTFRFDTTEYGNDGYKYRIVRNQIEKCLSDKRYGSIAFGEIHSVGFTTHNASGEVNDVEYTFMSPRYPKVTKTGDCVYDVTFRCGEYHRGDLLKKYYSESMAEKYANNERKKVTLGDVKDEFVCVNCGEKIDRETMEKNMGRMKAVELTLMVMCDKCADEFLKFNETERKAIEPITEYKTPITEY